MSMLRIHKITPPCSRFFYIFWAAKNPAFRQGFLYPPLKGDQSFLAVR